MLIITKSQQGKDKICLSCNTDEIGVSFKVI